MKYAAFDLAERLEQVLGDPADPESVFSYARCADLDDADEFPADICRILDDFGLQRHYIPVEFGGELADYQDCVQMMRMIARRDVTVAVAHGKTYLGAVSAWVGGSSEQSARLAETITAGIPVSWSLTEQAHGSDLLAGEVTAHALPGANPPAYRLNGEKWLINNATRGGALCVLARTREAGGPRGFSVFLVDKATLSPDAYSHVPKLHTHGIRGADISGIRFSDAVVGAEGLLGAEGTGLETVLKGLQLTRTLCCALSLGAGDHALAVATRFALKRELYGHKLADLPAARHKLATAYADHLLTEAFSVVGSRAIQTLTGEMSILAAAIKYLAPTRTEAMITQLRRLLGARSLLRDVHEHGSFGKVERDHRIVSLFDGNTLVNLNALINLFPLLLRAADNATAPDEEGLRQCTDLAVQLPPTRHDRLSLLPCKGSSFLLGLPEAVAELTRLAQTDDGLAGLASSAGALRDALEDLYQAMRTQPSTPLNVPAPSFVLAQRLAACLGGAAILQLWLRNRDAALAHDTATTPLWRNGVWAQLALDRLLGELGVPHPAPESAYHTAFEVLHHQVSSGHLPSLFSVPLAEARS